MAKLQLDPKKIAAVKQVAAGTIGEKLAEKAQQLKGGVNLSAYDKAAGKKLLTNLTTDKAAAAAAGSPMGAKAVAAQGRGGQTMGQKAVIARGKVGPVVKAIESKLTGKPATASPAAKEEELKMGRYQLPSVIKIGSDIYDFKDIENAAKKVAQTYGKDSEEYKYFATGIGKSSTGNYGIEEYRKPDMRGDSKSYVDTIQYQGGLVNDPYLLQERYEKLGGKYMLNNTAGRPVENVYRVTKKLLDELGVKPGSRSLAADKNAVKR
jgi:hypothetical protein